MLTPFELTTPGAVVGGLNGVIAGAGGIYNWRSPRGVLAMTLDSLYESYNRAMAILILMQAMGLIGFDLRYRISLGRLERTAVLIAFLGWLGMAGGTASSGGLGVRFHRQPGPLQ